MRWLRRRPGAALSFEFQPQQPRAATGWLLLVIAGVLAADAAWSYAEVRSQTDDALRRLAEKPRESQAPQKLLYQPRDAEREAAFARGVITRIALPWNDLFQALDETQIEEVQLLAVEPDPETRTVRITAEARDIPAMLTYVARLESITYFRSVSLLQQELKREVARMVQPVRGPQTIARRPTAPSGPANAVSFVVSASWKQK